MEHGTGSRKHCCPRCGARMESERTHRCGSDTEEPEGKHGEGRPTEDRIRARAFEHYMGRGREDGHAMEDWLQAENELSNTDTARKCD